MMSALIKTKSNILETAHIQLKDTAVLSEISKAKAREETPDGMAMRAATDPSSSTNTLSFIAEVSFPNLLHDKADNIALWRVRSRITRSKFTRFR